MLTAKGGSAMRTVRQHRYTAFLIILMMLAAGLCSCSGAEQQDQKTDTSSYVVSVWDEPDTVDFQCTTLYYNTAYNVFDRLIKMETDEKGGTVIEPMLAESWKVSGDGRIYTFRLREGVRFSNGSPLTSEDVEYTFTRLLTHPDSNNRDIVRCIKGAEALESGKTDSLEGFMTRGDLDFTIVLDEPFEAFLACLTMPGASILDKETTEKAGDSFGKDAEHTIGTGPFILDEWTPGKGMLYSANKDCWAGAPESEGLDVRFVKDSETIRTMFDEDELDIMDLEDLDNSSEFYTHGDIYKDRRYEAQQVGITYIALNESLEPLNDVRVRKALQLAVDRELLLNSVYDGLGSVENGIYPRGLYGFDPDLEAIPFDPGEARRLLAEAGYPGGFDITFSVRSSSSQNEMEMVRMISDMWEAVGVNAMVEVIDEKTFMEHRKNGELSCYEATWIADYNDPDNFIYTFFGNSSNTKFRSLCYPDEKVMERVRLARTITDPDKRVKEYRELERKIIQEDAAWVPLFSRKRVYVTSERLDGFRAAWTGRYFANYREMSVGNADKQKG